MSTRNFRDDPQFLRSYARGMLRSAFVSLFWSIISARKKRTGGFTMQSLAKAIGSTKHEVSRWFSGEPNWTLNTVASIAFALDVDLIIQARERSTGIIFTPSGPITPQFATDALKPVTITSPPTQDRNANADSPANISSPAYFRVAA